MRFPLEICRPPGYDLLNPYMLYDIWSGACLWDAFGALVPVGLVEGTLADTGAGVTLLVPPPARVVVDTNVTAYGQTDLMVNGGFETAGVNGPDVWGTWWELAGDGVIADATGGGETHGGAHAAKLSKLSDDLGTALIYQTITVIPGYTYTLSFWCRGDGAERGLYRIFDVSNDADILAPSGMGWIGTAFTLMTRVFLAPPGCTSVRLYFYSPNLAVSAWLDDVSVFPKDFLVSVGGGSLHFSGGKIVPAWGDPSVKSGLVTHAAGERVFSARVRPAGSGEFMIGWFHTDGSPAHALHFGVGGGLVVENGASIGLVATYGWADTWVKIRVAAGEVSYWLSTDGIVWVFLYVEGAGDAADLVVGVQSYDAALTTDDWRVISNEVPVTFDDSFERANGAMGTAPGGLVYHATGPTLPVVSNGQMVLTATDEIPAFNGYAEIDFPATPTRMFGKIVFSAGAPISGNVVFSSSSNQGDRIWDQVHTVFDHLHFATMKRVGGVVTGIGTWIPCAVPLVAGVEYDIEVRISGNTLTIVEPDGTLHSVTDPDIGATAGPYCYIQIGGGPTSAGNMWPAWNSWGARF